MYKIFKGFNCRTVKGTTLAVQKGTVLKSYVVNYERDSVTLNFPDMTVEVENDFDIAEHIHPNQERYNKEDEHKHTQVEQDAVNYNKRINTAAVLNYFHKIITSRVMDIHVTEWIESERERLKDEMKRLDILTASDEDIIQNALMEYGNQERYNGDIEIANKITDVRNRYLEMLNSKDKGVINKT